MSSEDLPTGWRPINLQPGQKFGGRYDIIAQVGGGAMGVVYRARDPDLDKVVALKVLPFEISWDPKAVGDLRREAAIASELSHPNIVRIYDTGVLEGIRFIKMEFVDGISLAEHLRRNKTLEEREILEIVLPILDALAYAHRKKVVHRDIKPANILLGRDLDTGEIVPKVADFGIARILKDTGTRLTGRMTSGTLLYMAPEQIRGCATDPRSDLYSFGATLYELASGHPPFYTGAIEYQILNEKPASLRESGRVVSEAFDRAILKCLAKAPDHRFQSAGELREALEKKAALETDVKRGAAGEGRPAGGMKLRGPLAGFEAVGIKVDQPSGLPRRIRHIETDMELVLVPAGEFLMGSTDDDPAAGPDEKPQHTVYLDAFWIGITPVTNRQFRLFQPTHHSPDNFDGDDQPVVQVSWEDAIEFCERVGMRLPTEAEWEKAARGSDGRKYPWGNEPPSRVHAHYGAIWIFWGKTSPVGAHPKGASPYGALDMAGNVNELVSDWFGESYYTFSPSRNPKGPSTGKYRVGRGGSWCDLARHVRSSTRFYLDPTNRDTHYGFRCARMGS